VPRRRGIPEELRDRCLNCLSFNHRIATCRRRLRCHLCHDLWHLARDCTRRRTTNAAGEGTPADGQRRILQARPGPGSPDTPMGSADGSTPLVHHHRQPHRATLATCVIHCRLGNRTPGLQWRAASFSAALPSTTPRRLCGTHSPRSWPTHLGRSSPLTPFGPSATSKGSRKGVSPSSKGRRGRRRVVGPTGAKSSFHMAINGSWMKNPMECRIRNKS